MNKYLPEAPQGIRIVIHGVAYPCKIRYVGVGPSGEHVWAALWPEGEPVTWEGLDRMEMDTLPAMTSVMIEVPEVPRGT